MKPSTLVDTTKTTNSPVTPTTVTDVYVAGYTYSTNKHNVAAYWKNGKIIKLGDSTLNSYATGIAVDSNNNVYVVGYRIDTKAVETGVYWKNGNFVLLNTSNAPQDTINSFASCIAIKGNDVYTGGSVHFNYTTFWKNNLPSTLNANGQINSVFLNNNDLYFAGKVGDTVSFWKNGTMTKLGVAQGYAYITIAGTDIFVATSIDSSYRVGNSFNYFYKGVYWRNGMFQYLPGQLADYNCITGMDSKENDIYIAGTIYNGTKPIAGYWKNGIRIDLTNGTSTNYAGGIKVIGSDVYLAVVKDNKYPSYYKNNLNYPLEGIGNVTAITVVTHSK